MFRKILSAMGVLLVLTLLFAGCSSDEKTTNAPADTKTYLHIPFPVDSYFEQVRSISVTVTAADIDTAITAIDTTIVGTTQSEIVMTIPAGANRLFDVAAMDSSGQQLYQVQLNAAVNSGERTDIDIMLSQPDTKTYLHIPFPVDRYFERVRSLSVIVTAADIDTPLTAIDTTIVGTTLSDIAMTIPAGADRHFEVAALDSSGQQLYRTQLDATVNSGARTDISVMLFPMGYSAPNKVKLFRDTPPWGTIQPDSVLISLGFTQGAGANQYQVFNSSQMGSIVLTPGIDLVIFQAYQDTTFYKNYLANRAFFETFVQDGGTMFFLYATDIGNRSDSAVNMIFPGGVDYTFHTNRLNHPAIVDHPITAGIAHDLSGNSASHGYFDSLVAGTLILTVDSLSNPTLVIYGYGQGTVVLSGQPLEFARALRSSSTWREMSTLLSRVMRFILGYDPTPEPLPKAGAPHSVESSTSLR